MSGCFTIVEVNVAATWNGMPIGNLKKDGLLLYIAEQEHKNSELLSNFTKEIGFLKEEVSSLKDVSTIRGDFDTRLLT